MANVAWPPKDKRDVLGARIDRLDGPMKTTGAAKYAYDINRPQLAYAKIVQSRRAQGKVTNVDVSEAENVPGVLATYVQPGSRGAQYPEITYEGDVVAAICAETEEIATEAAAKVRVEYEDGGNAVVMNDTDPSLAEGREQDRQEGDPEAGFNEADAISEGEYGLHCITHACLEAHGQTAEFRDGEHYVWPSTQNVSAYAAQLRDASELSADKIHIDCQYMGGGFGSKFTADTWGSICTILAKQTGRPVKLMLDRDMEHRVAGARPSVFARVKVGVKNDGTITAWESECWGSGGQQRWRMPPLPYILEKIPNYKLNGKGIMTNRGLTRAWRAPNHPQSCLVSMSAFADAAAAIGMDELEFFKRNLHLTSQPDVYEQQLDIAAELIGYDSKKHLRGDKSSIREKRGLGISLHTWFGQGHPSNASVTINPDGSVVGQCGTQDLGTGTRTLAAIVLAETLGLPVEAVTIEIGRNSYPQSGASGGSTTSGGVSTSMRDAGTQALNALLEKVAAELGVEMDSLEAEDGRIQVASDPSKGMSWEQACRLLGQMAVTRQGANPTTDGTQLTVGGVGGVGMADVTVDVETGVVKMNEYVAVQDCGLVVSHKTCESQAYGGTIMGITYALYEEAIYDYTTGAMLNPDFEFYRLAGLGDIGTIKVHLMRNEKFDSRGVTGIGEPVVISPGAAISNAVANAIGVRVPHLPLTPDRVLGALYKGGVS